jgi:hypothetical protein
MVSAAIPECVWSSDIGCDLSDKCNAGGAHAALGANLQGTCHTELI